jgi:Tol biopolymer transport system component
MRESSAIRGWVRGELLALACLLGSVVVVSCGGAAREQRTIELPPSEAGAAGEGGAFGGSKSPPSEGGALGGSPEPAEGGSGEGGAGGAGGEAAREPCEKTAEIAGGNLELVSLSLSCRAQDGDATFSRLSADGRFVGFDSDADDLIPRDLNGKPDAFLFDLETRELELISKHHSENRPVDGYSNIPIPSRDGRYVAFTSYTFELLPNIVPDGTWVYLRDRKEGTVKRFAASYACTYWLDMSADARFILAEGFSNCRYDLEDGAHESTFEYDTSQGTSRFLGADDGSDNYRPAVSSNGRFVLMATRPSGTRGQYVSRLELFDREASTSQVLPIYAYHYNSTAVSDDGNVIAYAQNGHVYRLELDTLDLTVVSRNAAGEPAEIHSGEVAMSADGRKLTFTSTGTDLVDDDTNGARDIFLYDAELDTLERVSVAPDGTPADDDSDRPHISADGTRLSFVSKARNLLPAATTGNWQLYVLRL